MKARNTAILGQSPSQPFAAQSTLMRFRAQLVRCGNKRESITPIALTPFVYSTLNPRCTNRNGTPSSSYHQQHNSCASKPTWKIQPHSHILPRPRYPSPLLTHHLQSDSALLFVQAVSLAFRPKTFTSAAGHSVDAHYPHQLAGCDSEKTLAHYALEDVVRRSPSSHVSTLLYLQIRLQPTISVARTGYEGPRGLS